MQGVAALINYAGQDGLSNPALGIHIQRNMIFRSTLLVIGALLCAPALAEQKISIDSGPGTHWSKGAHGMFLRYSDALKFPSYPEQEGFYEFSAGDWDGNYPNKALGLAIGARERWDDFHFDASGGLVLTQHRTHLSNTTQEFILRIGAGYRIERVDLGVYVTHYSNAKKVFGWDGKNVGYDFLTFQVGYIIN